MENNFAYIDNKPFDNYSKEKQMFSTFNINDNCISFQIPDYEKFFILRPNNTEIYAIDHMLRSISAFNIKIHKHLLTPIPNTSISSNYYIYGIKDLTTEENIQMKHFTKQTKIFKLIYYHENLSTIFNSQSLNINNSNSNFFIMQGKYFQKSGLGKIYFENNTINCSLHTNLDYHPKYYNEQSKITIQQNNSIVLKFKKGIYLNSAYRLINILDTVIHLMTLTYKSHNKIELKDFRNNKFQFIYKKYNDSTKNQHQSLFTICPQKEFLNLFQKLLDIEQDSPNILFPFLEYNRNSSLEISFLEYYRVLEYLNFKNQEKTNKGKNNNFLEKIFNENKELFKSIFDIKESEIKDFTEIVRSLRNYYSHEGYYLKTLPVPTKKPEKHIPIDIIWLKNVYILIKKLSYIEIYKYCNCEISKEDIIRIL